MEEVQVHHGMRVKYKSTTAKHHRKGTMLCSGDAVTLAYDNSGGDIVQFSVADLSAERASGRLVEMAATEDDTDPRCRPAGIMWSSLRNGDQRSAEATLTGEMPINFDKLWPGTTTKVYSGVQLKERPLIGLGHAVAAPFIASEGIYVVCIIESFNTKDEQTRWTTLVLDRKADKLHHIGLTHVRHSNLEPIAHQRHAHQLVHLFMRVCGRCLRRVQWEMHMLWHGAVSFSWMRL